MVDALVGGLPEDFKPIDILVNNAGLALGVPQTHENDPVSGVQAGMGEGCVLTGVYRRPSTLCWTPT